MARVHVCTQGWVKTKTFGELSESVNDLAPATTKHSLSYYNMMESIEVCHGVGKGVTERERERERERGRGQAGQREGEERERERMEGRGRMREREKA